MYAPKQPPTIGSWDELALYVRDELDAIAREFGKTDLVWVDPRFRPPAKPRDGMVVYADGTTWNPGAGRGTYEYNGAWRALFTGSDIAIFDTRSAAIAATISGSTTWLETKGYASPGDGGEGFYTKVGGFTIGGFQSADGAWWQLFADHHVNVRALGADPTSALNSTSAFNDAISIAAALGGKPPVIARGAFDLTPPLVFAGTPAPVIIRASGTWNLLDTWRQGTFLQVIGEGGYAGEQFGAGPHYLKVNGPGGTKDTWVVYGQSHHYLANVQLETTGSGIGLHLHGKDATSGETQGALAKFENVSSKHFGSGPAIQIDNFFWVWMTRCRALTNSGNPKALYLTNNPTGSALTGIVYVDDFIMSNGGIYIDAGGANAGIGGITFRDVSHENSIAPTLTLDSSNGTVYDIEVHNLVAADPVSGDSGLHIKGGPVTNVRLTGTNDLKKDITIEPGASLTGLYMDGALSGFQFTPVGWQQRVVGTLGDFLRGSLLSIGDALSPSVVPAVPVQLNKASQDAAGWDQTASDQGGMVTIAYGQTAPDGTPTAATITGASGPQKLVYDNRIYTPAVGDIVIWGGWIQNPNYSTKVLDGRILALRWIGGTATGCTTSGSVLTLGALVAGTFLVGNSVLAFDGTNTLNTTITSQLTGAFGGSAGATFQLGATASPGDLTAADVSANAAMNGVLFDMSADDQVTLNHMGWNGYSDNFGFPSPLGTRSSPGWLGVAGIASIFATPGGPQTLEFRSVAGSSILSSEINVWHPYYFYFPVGTITRDEAERFFQSLRRAPVAGVAGDIALLDHHFLKLGGGVRVDSAAAQPTKKVYAIGDRTFKTTGTSGWTCTAAGGASSTTRANTTVYATGVWAKWSSGATVVECTTSGTTAGAPPAAPTAVGQTVTDGSVVWTCRSLTQATFAVGL